MKKLSILFLFFISCAIILTPKSNVENRKKQAPSFIQKIPPLLESHALRISCVIVSWVKRKEIIATVKKHPFIVICLTLGLAKYFSDSYKMHSRIKKDFAVLHKIEELYSLISYAIEVSNIMIKASTTRSFNINEHFQSIVQDIPYSFEELEKMTLHVLVKWKLKLKEKYPSLYPPRGGIVEKESLIEDVDDTIYSFYENPLEEYSHVCKKIALEIKKLVTEIQKLNIIDPL